MKIIASLTAAATLLAVSHAYAAPKAQTSKSWVKLTAKTDRATYAPGQEIKVNLTATNTHKSAAYLSFTSGQRFDLKVFKAGTNESVYTWSATRMFTQMMGSLWLKPGQSQRYSDVVGGEMGTLPIGKYELRANLSNSPRPIVAAPVRFEIVGRFRRGESPASALRVTARTDKTRYREGEAVKIAVNVANSSMQAKTVDINWGMICDVRVRDAKGREVWNYGANIRFVRMLGPTQFGAGETKNLDFTWNGTPFSDETGSSKLMPGRYTVQAFVPSEPVIVSPPVTIEIG